jgi:hypothetical protein
MRLPLERRAIDAEALLDALPMLPCAEYAAMLVLIELTIGNSPTWMLIPELLAHHDSDPWELHVPGLNPHHVLLLAELS